MSQSTSNGDVQRTEPSPTLLKRLILRVKQAGAKKEAHTKRDGFLSYHAESHAAGMGIAAGWYATAQGSTELLGLVYGAAVYGRAHASNGKRRRILRDIVQEPHYALGGVVFGAVLGMFGNLLIDAGGMNSLLDALPMALSLFTLLP